MKMHLAFPEFHSDKTWEVNMRFFYKFGVLKGVGGKYHGKCSVMHFGTLVRINELRHHKAIETLRQ
jgi:hypothetical protein